MEELSPPAACPACRGEWSAGGQCGRCGLLRSEAIAALREGCLAFNRARRAAREGRFADAEASLRQVAACGVPALSRHPAVARLKELCAIAGGDARTALRVAAEDERAARNAVARCDFRAAAFYAERAAQSQPGSLPLQKLRLLTLYGAGRLREAATVYASLKEAAPADGELLRWNLPELSSILNGRSEEASGGDRTLLQAGLWAVAGCAIGFAVGALRKRREQSG